MKEHIFKYKFGSKEWTASVFADNAEQAKQKIRAQATAVYEGELVTRVPVLYGVSLLKRFFKRKAGKDEI